MTKIAMYGYFENKEAHNFPAVRNMEVNWFFENLKGIKNSYLP